MSNRYWKFIQNKNIEIIVKPEYEQLIPQLTSIEYTNLKQSIKESNGNTIPIIVNKEGIVIDGHHRFKACKELGITPKIELQEFSDPLLEKEFIITINLNRRHLNQFQISLLGYKLEEIEKQKAKIRQLKNLKNVGYSGISTYHDIRQLIYRFLYGEPLETLKWIVYKKWGNNQEGISNFICPHCGEIVATLPYNAEIGNCSQCKEQIFSTDMLGFHQEMSEDFASDQIVSNYMNVHELLLLFTGIRYFWEKDKDALENSLFVKDGPLMMPSQYSKLVEPIRQFIEFAQSKGYNINIIGQEKSGDFFEHLQLIGKDAPLKTMFIPNDSYIKEEIKQRPKKSFQHLYGEKTNYGAKVFIKLNNYHQMILNIPPGQFNPNPNVSDLIGIDRICSTLETILSYRYEGALLPIELVHGISSLSTYPSAEILKIFAKASAGSDLHL